MGHVQSPKLVRCLIAWPCFILLCRSLWQTVCTNMNMLCKKNVLSVACSLCQDAHFNDRIASAIFFHLPSVVLRQFYRLWLKSRGLTIVIYSLALTGTLFYSTQ